MFDAETTRLSDFSQCPEFALDAPHARLDAPPS
jgi:hypothetical protein